MMRATSHKLKAAFATSEVTSLESNYARIIPSREDTADPTTNVAENQSDVLQAADLFIRGSPRDHFFNCASLRAGTFSQAFETTPCQITARRPTLKLAKAIKVLDRRYVTDPCSRLPVCVAGPLQARPDSHTGASNADLIALEPHRGENNT
jgi:hypothetical protein